MRLQFSGKFLTLKMVTHTYQARQATKAEVLKVHDEAYVDGISEASSLTVAEQKEASKKYDGVYLHEVCRSSF